MYSSFQFPDIPGPEVSFLYDIECVKPPFPLYIRFRDLGIGGKKTHGKESGLSRCMIPASKRKPKVSSAGRSILSLEMLSWMMAVKVLQNAINEWVGSCSV